MANLTENTLYGSSGTQSPIANLSRLTKALQQKSQEASASTLSSGIVRHFNPEVASGIFSSTKAPEKDTGTFPVNEPIAPQVEGTKFEPIPEYEQFVAPDSRNLWATPSDKATLRNWPTSLGGGQYVTDPTQRGALIKSERVLMNDELNPGARKAVLGGLSSKLYQVDHIVPLWVGGADTAANLQILDLPTHERKTAAQSVPLTLLANGKIDLNQAKLMALTWKDKDTKGLPSVNEYGYVPLEVAEKYAKKWEEDMTKPKTWKYFGESFKEEMGNFGKGWLPAPLREFAKGLVGGGTAGIVPGTEVSPESGALGTAGNVAGNIVGTITGLGLLSKGIGAAFRGTRSLLGFQKAVSLADEAMKTAGLATDLGSMASVASKARAETLRKMAASSGLLSLWGQIGLSGREATGQQDAEFSNHMTQFFSDVAFGSLLGSSGQTLKGYAKVGLGTAALSLMEGEEIVPALQNAGLMTALHAMGYKRGMIDPKLRIGNEEAYKMSATTMNQYLGEVIPTVKKGQGVPSVLKLDIPVLDKMRTEYQKNYPNDQRFKDMGPITNEAEALDFIERAARRELGNKVAKSDGTIPQEDIKKEMTRIVVAKNQLYNQTLSPEARIQKEIQDLYSMGEKLRPQVTSSQLRPTIDKTKLLENLPFEFRGEVYDNPQGLRFPTGNVPTTGYGGNIDVGAKKNINDYYNNPKTFSEKLFVVKDPETASIMRLIEQEQLAAGKKSTVGNPDHALRVFVKAETPEGIVIKPVGYMPREVSFDLKKDNLNKTYYEITNRLRHTIETAKSPEELMTMLNKDKAAISINKNTAKDLFERKAEISKMPDEELYTILQPKNAYEKYNSGLNNSTISEEMDKHGLKVLVVDKSNLMPVGGGPPRYNPENPYISLNLNEQDWLRSIAIKDGTTKTMAPIEQAIKEIATRQKSENVSKTAGNILKSEAVLKKPVQETLPTPQTPSTTAEIAPKMPQVAPKVETVAKMPKEEVSSRKTPEKLPKKGLIEGLIERSKLTAKEAAPYMKMEKRIAELNDAASSRYLKSSELRQMESMGKQIRQLMEKKGLIQPARKVWGKVNTETRKRSSNEILKSSLLHAEGEMDFVKGENVEKSPEAMAKALRASANKALAIISENKAGLTPTEQKELKRAFQDGVENMVQERVDTAFGGNTNLSGQKYSETVHQYVGIDPTTGKEIPIREYKEKKPFVTSDQQLADRWGLKVDDKGYLALDKNRQPVFTEEFKKQFDIKQNITPTEWYKGEGKTLGELFKGDLEANLFSKTSHSQSFMRGIDEASKDETFGPLFKGFKKIIDITVADPKSPLTEKNLEERLKSTKDSRAGGNWKLNALFNEKGSYLKKLFSTTNPQGQDISQPKERIFAKSEEQLKKIDEKTVDIEQKAKEAKLERDALLDPEGTTELPKGLNKEDLKGMSQQDVSQMEKIHDLTKFESLLSSMQYQELTGKSPTIKMMADDVVKLGRDFISNYNASIKPESKTRKAFIGKEGWKKIREYLTENLEKEKSSLREDLKKPKNDGKGGLLGDAWSGVKNTVSNLGTMHYEAPDLSTQKPVLPKENTYDVRGIKVGDSDLNEAANILYGEISNRPEAKQQFEIRHIVNTAINRAKNNPKGFGGTLTQVLQKPYQYQSYAPEGITKNGKVIESQYQKLKRGALNETDKKKLKLITDTLGELKSGKFKDTTGDSMFYVHASDGTLWLGKTTKEAKKNADKHEKELKLKKTQWNTAQGAPVLTQR